MPTSPATFNPFPGLRPFQMEEEYLFFGRETQRKELIALLREHRFVAVLGASGSGKSSLVRAGLLPALFGGVMTKAGSHWNVAILRPGGRPIANLAEALLDTELWSGGQPPSPLELETALSRSGLGLLEAVRQARPPQNENLLVVVDQFEELFRFSASQSERGTRDEAAAFVNLLLEAARQVQVSIYVVLTMRSDFFGDCSQFEDLAEAINKGEYLVPRLTRDQKKQAIEGPIKVGGAQITPRLLQRLLNDVGDDPDQLPVMQHALMRTWTQWAGDHADNEPLDLRHYESIGGMREALSRHADEVFAELPDDRHRLVAERTFKALTERGADNRGIRRPTRVAQLAAITGATEGEVQTVLQAFRQAGRTFLMPPEQVALDADTVIDISHESLMRVWQRLRHWVEQEAQSARIYSRLAETAALHADGKADLYHDPDLQIALSWRKTAQPNAAWAQRYHAGFELAVAFLEKSAAAKRSEDQARETARQKELEQAKALAKTQRRRAEEQIRFAARLKWFVRGLGLVALIALTAFAAAWFARQEARRQAQLAELNRETADRNARQASEQANIAREQRDLAEQKTAESQQLAAALKSTLTRADFVTGVEHLEADEARKGLSYLARSLRTDPTYWPAAFRLLSTLTERSFSLDLPKPIQHDKPILDFEFHDRTGLLVTRTEDNERRLWDSQTSELLLELPQTRKGTPVLFSPEGDRLMWISTNGVVQLVDPRKPEGLRQPMQVGRGIVTAMFSGQESVALLLAAKAEDGSLQVWDARTGLAMTASLRTEGQVGEFALTPDGTRLCGVFSDGSFAVWEAHSGQLAGKPGKAAPGSSLSMSPDSRTLALRSPDGKTLRFWNLDTGEPRSEPLSFDVPLPEPPRFSPDGQLLVAVFHPLGAEGSHAPFDLTVRVFDVSTGKVVTEFQEKEVRRHWENVAAGLSLTLGKSSEVKLKSLATGKPILELPRQEKQIVFASLNDAGDRLVTLFDDEDRTVRIWDARTGEALTEPMKHKAQLNRLLWSPEGERFLTVTMDFNFRIWDARSGRPLAEPQALAGFSGGTVFTRDGIGLLIRETLNISGPAGSRTTYGVIRRWNTLSGKALNKPFQHPDQVHQATFSPDGTRILTALNNPDLTVTPDGSFGFVWDAPSGRALVRLAQEEPIPPTFDYRSVIAFSPEGDRVAACTEDNSARLWEVSTGRLIAALDLKSAAYLARFSPDGRKLLTCSGNGTNHVVSIWDSQSGRPSLAPLRHGTNLATASFSADGTKIVTATVGKAVRVWDALQGAPLTPPLEHQDMVLCAEFSPDGRKVASGSIDQTARVWNADTGQLLFELPHQDWVWTIAFSSDGQRLLTAGGGSVNDPTLAKLWDLNTGRLVAEPLNCKGRVVAARFSPDGQMVLAGAEDGTTRLWEAVTGKPITEPFKQNDHVGSVAFSPDGTRILTGSHDRTARLWSLPPRTLPIPDWLPRLAETLAGQRINDQGGSEAVPRETLSDRRAEALRTPSSDPYTKWAAWFFADRSTRTIDPSSNLTVPGYVEELIQTNTLESLRKALQLSPTNAQAFARLARKLAAFDAGLEKPWGPDPHFTRPAEWYSAQATNHAPHWVEGLWTRADILDQFGKTEDALKTIDQALALAPENPSAWCVKAFILARRGQADQAERAYTKAKGLASASEAEQTRRNPLFDPLNLATRLHRYADAAAANLATRDIPAREPDASSQLIDLTPFYNAALTESWSGGDGHDLAELPPGIQTLAGVKFDLRGLVQVSVREDTGDRFPASVRGIVVGRKCRQLHFLHSAIRAFMPDGTQVARYVIHYDNGETREVPVVKGQDLDDWFGTADEAVARFVVAWRGANKTGRRINRNLRLYKTTWANPLPDVPITSFDFVAMKDAAPFLLAVTAQSEPSPVIASQPQSQEVEAGGSVSLSVEVAGSGPWAYQWQHNGTNLVGATNATLALRQVRGEQTGRYVAAVHAALPDNVAVVLSQPAGLTVKSADIVLGALKRELFYNFPGSTLADLTNSMKFPARPDASDLVYEFESPGTRNVNYGVRLLGYLIPPVTGEYLFYLASDDQGELWLSTDESPANLRRIAAEPIWNMSRDWHTVLRRPAKENISAPIPLTAGQRYYVEAVMKQGTGGDHLAVTWQSPGAPKPANGASPIAGPFLAYPARRRE
jgi:WD40 repeat protein